MRKTMVGFGLAIVLALLAAAVSAQQSVAGSWVLSAHGMSLDMVLVQDGEKVSGSLDSPHGLIQLKGEFSKGKLTLSGSGTASQPLELSGTATLTADGSLSGTLSVNLIEIDFTAVRSAGK